MDQFNTPPQVPYAYTPPQNPIAGPTKVFGIIYAVLGVLSLLSIFSMTAMGSLMARGGLPTGQAADAVSAHMMGFFFMAIAIIAGLAAILYAFTAYGLLTAKSWGRTLLIITSILSLISIPVGTILGGFALYFFMRGGAREDYDRLVLAKPKL